MTNRQTGEVYLEGALERGIVPEDCVWTHGGGNGEEGMMLYLQKMNLELLQKWVHWGGEVPDSYIIAPMIYL